MAPDTAAGVVSAVEQGLEEASEEAGSASGVTGLMQPLGAERTRRWTPLTRNRLSRKSSAPWKQR